jgi:hypothetical protein
MGGSILFRFEPHVPLAEAEMSLHLAMFAVEGLAGRVQVHLNANYQIDAEKHTIAIDGHSRVGRMIARVFAGLLLREFGEDAFSVEHVSNQSNPQAQEVHA